MMLRRIIGRSKTTNDLRSFQTAAESNLSVKEVSLNKVILGSRQYSRAQSSNPYSNSCDDVFHCQNSDSTGYRNGAASSSGANPHTTLAPPMPPIAPASRLRRANSSTLSLTKNKRKMLTVSNNPDHCLTT